MRCARRPRRWAAWGLAALLVVAVAGAAGMAVAGGGAPVAWADDPINVPENAPTNQDVPTDEAGVVDPSAREEASDSSDTGQDASGAGTGTGAGAGADGEGAAPAPEGAEDAPGAEGAAASGAEAPAGVVPEEGAAELTPPPPRATDPVFGDGVSENNLVNPQQKPDSSFIYDTSIGALQEADSYLNNQIVQVTGEVVGDRINAEFDPGFCWIVLQGNDKARSEVPVFIATDATGGIDTYGAYGKRGTMLQIRGIFYLSCPQHQGLTDLHADTVSVVEKGSITEQVFDIGSFVPGLVLVGIGAIMIIVFHRMREGQR